MSLWRVLNTRDYLIRLLSSDFFSTHSWLDPSFSLAFFLCSKVDCIVCSIQSSPQICFYRWKYFVMYSTYVSFIYVFQILEDGEQDKNRGDSYHRSQPSYSKYNMLYNFVISSLPCTKLLYLQFSANPIALLLSIILESRRRASTV